VVVLRGFDAVRAGICDLSQDTGGRRCYFETSQSHHDAVAALLQKYLEKAILIAARLR